MMDTIALQDAMILIKFYEQEEQNGRGKESYTISGQPDNHHAE